MFSLRQFSLGLSYYFQAIVIFWRLRNYLKHDFLSDLDFPSDLQKEYYYRSNYYNRTKQYMHANHFFGELLCVLRGSKMNERERKRFANLSACAPIFDDFFDKEYEQADKIKKLLNQEKHEIAETEQQKLAVLFLDTILCDLDEKQAFLNAANSLFSAQLEAKNKQISRKSPQELWQFSRQKGGFSGLMYALLLIHSLTDEEKEIAFLLGAFGQFMDDVFDLYDDRLAGIYTLPNTAQSVSEIETVFIQIHQEILRKVNNIKQSEKIKNKFSNILQLLAAPIRLALFHYHSIELKYKIAPNQCQQLERKIWIVDMEKPTNAFKMFKISLNYLH